MNHYENDDRRNDDASFGDQAEGFSRKLSDSAQQVFFGGLEKEGEAGDPPRRERNGEQGPGWRDNVETSLDEAREKASGTWNKVEKAFDDQVQGVLKRLHVPTADEVTALEARIDALQARLAKLENRAASGTDAPAPGSHQSPGSVP